MPVPCQHTWRLEDPTEDAPRVVIYRCPKCRTVREFPLEPEENPASARNRIIRTLMRGDVLEKAGVGDR